MEPGVLSAKNVSVFFYGEIQVLIKTIKPALGNLHLMTCVIPILAYFSKRPWLQVRLCHGMQALV